MQSQVRSLLVQTRNRQLVVMTIQPRRTEIRIVNTGRTEARRSILATENQAQDKRRSIMRRMAATRPRTRRLTTEGLLLMLKRSLKRRKDKGTSRRRQPKSCWVEGCLRLQFESCTYSTYVVDSHTAESLDAFSFSKDVCLHLRIAGGLWGKKIRRL